MSVNFTHFRNSGSVPAIKVKHIGMLLFGTAVANSALVRINIYKKIPFAARAYGGRR